MKHHLRIESFRELTLVTWDERVEGAERVRFADARFAEAYLRGFLDDPSFEYALRAFVGAGVALSYDYEGVDVLLREAAERLVDKRLKVYERALTKYFSDIPIGTESTDKPVDPNETDDPVEPTSATPTPKNKPPPHWELEASVDGEQGDDCFDESTLHLRARLKDGTATRKDATFTLFRNGTAFHTQEVQTSDPKIELLLPRVGDDEASWTLEFKYQYGDDVYSGTRVYTVWPKTVLLRAQHRKTSLPVKGARFTVTQDETNQAAETAETGEVEHHLAKPAPFTVDAESPWVVRSWTRDTGRIREARVERLYKAAFHAPKKPDPDKAKSNRSWAFLRLVMSRPTDWISISFPSVL